MIIFIILTFIHFSIPTTKAAQLQQPIIPGTSTSLIETNLQLTNNTRSDSTIYYYISKSPATYSNAFNYCALSGRKLAMIKSDVEQARVTASLIDASYEVKGNVWLNSYCFNGIWYWGDNSPVTYNNLPQQRTDCYGNNLGIVMYGTQTPRPDLFTWVGMERTETNYFVCQSP